MRFAHPKLHPELLRFFLVTIAFSSVLYGSHVFSNEESNPQKPVQHAEKEKPSTTNNLYATTYK